MASRLSEWRLRHSAAIEVVLLGWCVGLSGCGVIETGSVVRPSPADELASADDKVAAVAPQPRDENDVAADEAAIPPAETEQLIDLSTTLVLAGADNPTIALAEEAVQASRATLLQARALLLPTLNAGSNFNFHTGNLQSSQGVILDVDRQALYVGAGARAVGAGTVAVPGIQLTAHLADACYEPAAARYAVEGRRFSAQVTHNAILLEVATRYLDLVGAEARLAILRRYERAGADLARLTANFARTGQGREADALRARSSALLLRIQEQAAGEAAAVAAADLARLLSLNPSIRLHTVDHLPAPLQLVDPGEGLEELIAVALRQRPEIVAATAAVAVNDTHRRQEKARPLLPQLSVGYSAGNFGGGSDQADNRFGHFRNRTDFDVWAVWSLENLGFGNRAVQQRWRAAVGEAEAERQRWIARIRREVAEAHALSADRSREVEVGRRQVQVAEEAYRLDLIRARNLEGKPIEVLSSLDQLVAAWQEWAQAVVGYNQAQFQLLVALGLPPTRALGGDTHCP